MHKYISLTIIALLAIVCPLWAQDETPNPKADKVKTGWNIGGLPAVSYSTDLGFQYGLIINLFNYGDGSIYPKYRHNLYAEVSRYTKGSGINRFFYDSKYLIPNIRLTADVSYLTDKLYDFYGFNGYEAVYNKEWDDDKSDNYRSRAFYKYDRKLFRVTADFQGKLSDERWGWVAGFGAYRFWVDTVDIARLNKGKTDKLLPAVGGGLYQHYADWGIIDPEEAHGGMVTYLKVGGVLDTRDNEPNPMRGMWTEVVLNYAPPFLGPGRKFSHAKLAVVHRQYFTLYPETLSIVYRLAYQGTLWGRCPFYMQPTLATLYPVAAVSEGLGGAKSIRGLLRNRVVGDGIAYGNLEMRWKFLRFHLLNQNFYLSLNAFADAGMVVQRVKEMDTVFEPLGDAAADFYKRSAEGVHATWGLGLRIVMNQNFVVAVDHGRTINEQDGKTGTYIGLNFLF